MKNPNFNKQDYKALKQLAKQLGVRFIYVNNAVIAYGKALPSDDCRMINVAVAWRAPEDAYVKKIGKFQALDKLLGGAFITLPFGFDFDEDEYGLELRLAYMFDTE